MGLRRSGANIWPQEMSWDFSNALHLRKPLSRNLLPLGNGTTAGEAKLASEFGDKPALRSDQVHSIHASCLAPLSRWAQAICSVSMSACCVGYRPMKIGDLIRQKRNERGLTQRELAKILGVSHSAIAQWEQHDTGITNSNWAAVRSALSIAETIESAPDAPYPGQIVDDPDKLAWLRFWESLTPERRVIVTDLLHIGLPSREPPKAD